jgi:transposase
MVDFSRVQNYYIACGYTDMRKQIDGLVAVVRLEFKREVDETTLYLFCGRKADRIKALYWDGTGYLLLYKRLSEKRFQWPRREEELKQLTRQEFRWLMEGLSIAQRKAFAQGKPGDVC